jgi:hypothetical protein
MKYAMHIVDVRECERLRLLAEEGEVILNAEREAAHEAEIEREARFFADLEREHEAACMI